MLLGHSCHIVNRCDLRYTDAGYDAGGADGARADADLQAIGTCGDQLLGCLGSCDIAGDDRGIREFSLELLEGIDDVGAVAVCGIEHEDIDLCSDQGACAVEHIGSHADAGAAEQSAAGITGRIREFHGFFDVLNGDQTLEVAVLVHDRELLDLVLAQDLLCLLEGGAHRCGDEAILGHDIADLGGEIGQEAHVAVGDDADQLALAVNDRNTGNAELAHQLVGILDKLVLGQGEGIDDNAVLGTLDLVYLVSLLFDGHILVDDADAALSGNGDGHTGVGDGIHSCGDDGGIQMNVSRKTGT